LEVIGIKCFPWAVFELLNRDTLTGDIATLDTFVTAVSTRRAAL